MEKDNSFIINPRNYETWVGFAHDFCKGCKYENGSFDNEDKRINECINCIEVQDHYYFRENEHPINITKNEDGKNIAKSIIEK